MSRWITDRKPTADDADRFGYVYNGKGLATQYNFIDLGEPWLPTFRPEPYVEPLRWEIMTPEDQHYVKGPYAVYLYIGGKVADQIPTREAAERIAKIYMEARS